MSCFGSYSAYYDLLYQDKDYEGETAFIHNLIQRHCPGAGRVLDLGCGTGRHDIRLAERGMSVCGVDSSTSMIERALLARATLSESSRQRVSFFCDDLRNLQLGEKFSCVLSLFHVMSYLVENEDLKCAFNTIRQHLIPGGIAIFDCWYGPAVLNLRPSVRVKEFEFGETSILRSAEPILHPNNNLVDVRYVLWIKNRKDAAMEVIRETHKMRYLFLPELRILAQQSDLQILEAREWMTDRTPGLDTWGVYFVVQG